MSALFGRSRPRHPVSWLSSVCLPHFTKKEESANGAGRRGSLLIQAVAEGVTQLEGKSPSGSRGRVQLRDGSARLPQPHVTPQSRKEVSASCRAAISAGRA